MIKILGELKRCVIVLLLLCCAALCIIGGALFAQATANNADNTDTPLTLNETSFIFNEDKTEILGLTEQTKEKIKALSSRFSGYSQNRQEQNPKAESIASALRGT